MGVCCSKDGMYRESSMEEDVDEREDEADEEDDIRHGDGGARIRLQGPSRFTSMYTQQGRKGINQDSMTVWEVTFFSILCNSSALISDLPFQIVLLFLKIII